MRPSLVFSSHLNTHIVTDDAALAKRLRQLRIGDESRCKASWSITATMVCPRANPHWCAVTQAMALAKFVCDGLRYNMPPRHGHAGCLAGYLAVGGRGGGVCAHTASRALNKATSGL